MGRIEDDYPGLVSRKGGDLKRPPRRRVPPGAPGVAFHAPPGPILGAAMRVVEEAAKDVEPGHGTFMVDIETDKGWNAAVVHKVNTRWVVGAWMGKTWGTEVTGGAVIRGSW